MENQEKRQGADTAEHTHIFEEAIYSDGSALFRSPMEPKAGDRVTLRLRIARESTAFVFLEVAGRHYKMQPQAQDEWFTFYETTITVGEEKLLYYFTLLFHRQLYYYGSCGLQRTKPDEQQSFWILPWFQTPDWAKGAVFYQIFVDRFCNGDVGNDVRDREYSYINEGTVQVRDWYKPPATMGVREFYGGDLLGVYKKLDYLKELGVEVLYFNPIFVSPSNHKYDIQDYDYIDPHFGVIVRDGGACLPEGETKNECATKYIARVTDYENLEASNQFFAFLVAEIHKRGMRVILDGVFNHCGSFHKWLDREGVYKRATGYAQGAYQSAHSPYASYFRFREQKEAENDSYDGWWGHDTLPKLNYEASPELENCILEIAKKWVSPPYHTDGWRLDVAADLGHSADYNHLFWKKFRKAVREANPDALILAEHYGDAFDWLQGDEWDSVMNYDGFMEPVTWFLTGMEKHSDEFNFGLLSNYDTFYGAMRYVMTRLHTSSLLTAMNELSNHDHSRFLTRTNMRAGRTATAGTQAADEGVRPEIMREAVVIQMTWLGAPTVYYGDEAGVCGWTDPDSRRTYPWGHEDHAMLRFHKELIRIHKSYQALRTGSLLLLHGEQGVLCYGRFDAEDTLLVAVNNNSFDIEITVPAWRIGMFDRMPLLQLVETYKTGYDFSVQLYWTKNGLLTLPLKPYAALILKNMAEYMYQSESQGKK